MMMSDLDWEDLKIFKEVAAHRTVRAAAKSLGVHHSTVSRRIEHLEMSLGVRLLDRSPEGTVLTGPGERLLEVAKGFAEDLLSVSRQIFGQDADLSGVVTVTMAEPLAEHAFAPRLPEFAAAYPGLELHLITTTDFLDVGRREADVAIRMDNNPPQTLVGKRLFRYRETVYASPAYLESHDLKAQPQTGRWLRWCLSDEPYPDWTQDTEFAQVPCWGFFPDLRVQQVAARHGLGLTMLPCLIGDRDAGLVRATPRPPLEGRDVWVLTHSDLRNTARVRAFMTFAEHVLRAMKPQFLGHAVADGA